MFKLVLFFLLFKNESCTVSTMSIIDVKNWNNFILRLMLSNLYISYINILHESFSFLIHLLML